LVHFILAGVVQEVLLLMTSSITFIAPLVHWLFLYYVLYIHPTTSSSFCSFCL